MIPEYLCIGHVCHDVKGEGYVLGGSSAYSSICATRLGKKAGIVTSFGDDFQFFPFFKNIAVHNKKAIHTTLFENIYKAERRTQYLHQQAATICAKDLPQAWLKVPLVHLAPIADEVNFDILSAFSKETIIAATPQGWLRKWDAKTRKIRSKSLNWAQLAAIDILILSDEDLKGQEQFLPTITELIDLVILTRGHLPASVYTKGEVKNFPVFPVKVVDPTGAGDAFTAGFLAKYLETKDLAQSMAYGHVVASFCIEAEGMEGLKNLNLVGERFVEYQKITSY